MVEITRLIQEATASFERSPETSVEWAERLREAVRNSADSLSRVQRASQDERVTRGARQQAQEASRSLEDISLQALRLEQQIQLAAPATSSPITSAVRARRARLRERERQIEESGLPPPIPVVIGRETSFLSPPDRGEADISSIALKNANGDDVIGRVAARTAAYGRAVGQDAVKIAGIAGGAIAAVPGAIQRVGRAASPHIIAGARQAGQVVQAIGKDTVKIAGMAGDATMSAGRQAGRIAQAVGQDTVKIAGIAGSAVAGAGRQAGRIAQAVGKDALKVADIAGSAVVAGAIAAGQGIVAGSQAVAQSLTPRASPVMLNGDPDFFIRLKTAERVLEEVRVAEVKFNTVTVWNPPANQAEIQNVINASRDLAKEAVLATLRFLSVKTDDASVTGLKDAIDGSVRFIDTVLPLIDQGLRNNESNQPTGIGPMTTANLRVWRGLLNPLRTANASARENTAMNNAERVIDGIQNETATALARLNSDQLSMVSDYNSTVIRNVAVDALGVSLMTLPIFSDPAISVGITTAQMTAETYKRTVARPTQEISGPTVLQRISQAITPLPSGPTVSDLGSAFDKTSASILKKRGLGQSPEVTRRLLEKRAAQIKGSLPLAYVSDIGGTTRPLFPTQVTDSLLPFILIANVLLSTDPGADGSPVLTIESAGRIRSVEALMEMTISMADPRRLLADNLEMTLGASYFGYFVEPSKIKIVERMAKVISELPAWTKSIEGMTVDRFKKGDVVYMEQAMLSIISAVSDYCEVCRPRSGGLCDAKTGFAAATDNLARVIVLRKMGELAFAANPSSVLGEPLLALCTAIDRLLTNPENVKIQVTKLDVKGQFIVADKDEGSAEKRSQKSMLAIRELLKGVNYNSPVKEISSKILRQIIVHLDNIVRDFEAMEAVGRRTNRPGADELKDVAKDFRTALREIVKREENPESPSVPWDESRVLDRNLLAAWGFSPAEIENIRNLYRDIAYVSTSKFTRGLTGIFTSHKRKPEVVAAANTEEFALNSPGLKNLPPMIQVRPLVSALKSANSLDHERDWYDKLGKAIGNVYGTQTTVTTPDYKSIIEKVGTATEVNEMEQGLIQVALPAIVSKISPTNITKRLDVPKLGEQLYKDLAPTGLGVNTETLATAIAEVVPRIPVGVTLDYTRVAKSLANIIQASEQTGRRPTLADLSRVFIAEAVLPGAVEVGKILVARPDQQESVQRRLAEAMARVGPFRDGQVPAWAGIALPVAKR